MAVRKSCDAIMMKYFLKLRNNIALEGDTILAKREVCHLFENVEDVYLDNINIIPCYVPKAQRLSYIRGNGLIGFVATYPKVSLGKLAHLLSFIQEIWSENEGEEIPAYSRRVEDAICTIPLMAMSEILSFSGKPDKTTIDEIVDALSGERFSSKTAIKGILRVNTSSPHIHSFHKYKAKFFPRFVRSLIVSSIDLNKSTVTVCDPYVGSGTTLIESSLLGYDSFGFDIDPLSCFISEIKSAALNTTFADLETIKDTIHTHNSNLTFVFPYEIQKKFRRWDTLDEMNEYQQEISNELNLIEKKAGFAKQLNQIALSDALTRKFNIRMVGTGSGRFALEIAKTSLSNLIQTDIKSSLEALKTIEVIKDVYNISTHAPRVCMGNATMRNCQDETCDIIITSPPYLPASSGRENYLIGKMISLKALGLLDNKDQILKNSVGSMVCQNDSDLNDLPKSVADLYNWLINDELRQIKAAPIVAYYHSIKKSLEEDKRTIKGDGKIIYIIGKESVFYNNSTKEILYKVECDNIFIEIAKSVGLSVDEVVSIELDKKNAVARPRSSDKYYETAVILSKN